MGKAAVVAPAGTVTLDGTEAAEVLLLDSATTIPPAGAGPESVTVPVEGFPPTTLDGLLDTEDSEGGFTVSVADRVAPPYKADIVTAVVLATGFVEIVNVAPEAPAATVTVAGTTAAATLPLDSDTTAPPAGAGPVSVTVPVEVLPPATPVGLTLREEIPG